MKKQDMKEPEPEQDDMTTISIRNVSASKWQAVRNKAKKEGKYPWAVIDELFDLYLNKKPNPK